MSNGNSWDVSSWFSGALDTLRNAIAPPQGAPPAPPDEGFAAGQQQMSWQPPDIVGGLQQAGSSLSSWINEQASQYAPPQGQPPPVPDEGYTGGGFMAGSYVPQMMSAAPNFNLSDIPLAQGISDIIGAGWQGVQAPWQGGEETASVDTAGDYLSRALHTKIDTRAPDVDAKVLGAIGDVGSAIGEFTRANGQADIPVISGVAKAAQSLAGGLGAGANKALELYGGTIESLERDQFGLPLVERGTSAYMLSREKLGLGFLDDPSIAQSQAEINRIKSGLAPEQLARVNEYLAQTSYSDPVTQLEGVQAVMAGLDPTAAAEKYVNPLTTLIYQSVIDPLNYIDAPLKALGLVKPFSKLSREEGAARFIAPALAKTNEAEKAYWAERGAYREGLLAKATGLVRETPDSAQHALMTEAGIVSRALIGEGDAGPVATAKLKAFMEGDWEGVARIGGAIQARDLKTLGESEAGMSLRMLLKEVATNPETRELDPHILAKIIGDKESGKALEALAEHMAKTLDGIITPHPKDAAQAIFDGVNRLRGLYSAPVIGTPGASVRNFIGNVEHMLIDGVLTNAPLPKIIKEMTARSIDYENIIGGGKRLGIVEANTDARVRTFQEAIRKSFAKGKGESSLGYAGSILMGPRVREVYGELEKNSRLRAFSVGLRDAERHYAPLLAQSAIDRVPGARQALGEAARIWESKLRDLNPQTISDAAKAVRATIGKYVPISTAHAESPAARRGLFELQKFGMDDYLKRLDDVLERHAANPETLAAELGKIRDEMTSIYRAQAQRAEAGFEALDSVQDLKKVKVDPPAVPENTPKQARKLSEDNARRFGQLRNEAIQTLVDPLDNAYVAPTHAGMVMTDLLADSDIIWDKRYGFEQKRAFEAMQGKKLNYAGYQKHSADAFRQSQLSFLLRVDETGALYGKASESAVERFQRRLAESGTQFRAFTDEELERARAWNAKNLSAVEPVPSARPTTAAESAEVARAAEANQAAPRSRAIISAELGQEMNKRTPNMEKIEALGAELEAAYKVEGVKTGPIEEAANVTAPIQTGQVADEGIGAVQGTPTPPASEAAQAVAQASAEATPTVVPPTVAENVVAPLTRAAFEEQLRAASVGTKIDDDQIRATLALHDAVANTYQRLTGRPAEEYFSRFIKGVTSELPPHEAMAQSFVFGNKRFEAGRRLSETEKKQVLAKIGDSYRDLNAPKIEKGVSRYDGEPIVGYAYDPAYMYTSDITGAKIRHYITLPDGRRAHPSELFPNIKESDIERAVIEARNASKKEDYFKAQRLARVADNEAATTDIYKARNRPMAGSYVAEKDGKFIRVDGLDPADVKFFDEQGFKPVGGAQFQSNMDLAKAALSETADGKRLFHLFDGAIRGTTKSDFSSLAHESAHLWRNQMEVLAKETKNPRLVSDLKYAETWSGAKDGIWDTAAEERFAKGFERYLRDPHSYNIPEQLKSVFEQFKQWMVEIYANLRSAIGVGTQTEEDLPNDLQRMERVFKNWLSGYPDIDRQAVLNDINRLASQRGISTVSDKGARSNHLLNALNEHGGYTRGISEHPDLFTLDNLAERRDEAAQILQSYYSTSHIGRLDLDILRRSFSDEEIHRMNAREAKDIAKNLRESYAEDEQIKLATKQMMSEVDREMLKGGDKLSADQMARFFKPNPVRTSAVEGLEVWHNPQTGAWYPKKDMGAGSAFPPPPRGKLPPEFKTVMGHEVQGWRDAVSEAITGSPNNWDEVRRRVVESRSANASLAEARKVTKKQGAMFTSGEDSPLLSGTAQGGKAEAFKPVETGKQERMFSTAPTMGQKTSAQQRRFLERQATEMAEAQRLVGQQIKTPTGSVDEVLAVSRDANGTLEYHVRDVATGVERTHSTPIILPKAGSLFQTVPSPTDNELHAAWEAVLDAIRSGDEAAQQKANARWTELSNLTELNSMAHGGNLKADEYIAKLRDILKGKKTVLDGATETTPEEWLFFGERLGRGFDDLTADLLPRLGERVKAPPRLTPRIVDQLEKSAQSERALLSVAAQREAQARMNYALIDSNERRGIDNIMGLVYPFHHWYTRTYANWGRRILDKPWMAAGFLKMQNAIEESNRELPQQYRHQIPVDINGTTNYWDWQTTLNPLKNLVDDFSVKEREPDDVGKILNGLGSWGPSPWMLYGMAYGLMKAAQGDKETFQAYFNYVLPQTRLLRATTALAREAGLGGGTIPAGGFYPEQMVFDHFGLKNTGDMWEQRRVGKAMADVLGRTDPATGKPITATDIMRASYYQSGSVWDMARQQAMVDTAGGTLLSYLGAAGLKARPESLIQIEQAQDEYYKLNDAYFDKRSMSAEEYSKAMNTFYAEHPWFTEVRMARAPESERAAMFYTDVLNRIPPGSKTKTYEASGMGNLVKEYYDQDGTRGKAAWLETMQTTRPDAYKRFQLAMEGWDKQFNIPSSETKTEWSMASAQYQQMLALPKGDFAASKAFRQANPLIDKYYPLGDTSRLWDAYYGLDPIGQKILRDSPEMKAAGFGLYLDKGTRDLIDPAKLGKLAAAAETFAGRIKELPAYKGYVGTVAQQFGGDKVYAKQDAYFDLPEGQPRKDYLAKNPDLKTFWEWREAYLLRYPELKAAFNGTGITPSGMASTVNGGVGATYEARISNAARVIQREIGPYFPTYAQKGGGSAPMPREAYQALAAVQRKYAPSVPPQQFVTDVAKAMGLKPFYRYQGQMGSAVNAGAQARAARFLTPFSRR